MAEDFAVQVGRWCDRAGDLADAAFRAIAEEALAKVKELTPVRTGNLRAGWQVVVDGEQTTVQRLANSVSTPLEIGTAVGTMFMSTPAGAVVSGVNSAVQDLAQGNSASHAAVTGAGTAAGQVGGTFAGAAIGVAVAGPIGGVVGGLAGGFLGSTGGGIISGANDAKLNGSATVPEVQVGQKIVIVNPIAYARRVNYGFVGEDSRGRHYEQHGAHMVEQTVAELPRLASAAVRRLLGSGV